MHCWHSARLSEGKKEETKRKKQKSPPSVDNNDDDDTKSVFCPFSPHKIGNCSPTVISLRHFRLQLMKSAPATTGFVITSGVYLPFIRQ